MGAHLINRDKLISAYIGFHTVFNDALRAAGSAYKDVSMEVPSDNPIEQYKWLGELPLMKKWIGDREIAKLEAEGQQITNDDWANGIEVSRDDLRDDKLGLVHPRIRGLAAQGVRAIDGVVFGILNNAFGAAGGKTYDGQFLCDTDHTAAGGGGTAQSNKGTAGLSAAAMEAGIVAMTKFKDRNGEPLGVFPTRLVTGPDLWPTARKILGQNTLATGEENVNKGLLKYTMSPRITGNKWFLVDESQGVMPIIVQIRQAPTFEDPNLDGSAMDVFMRKRFVYGASMAFGVGLGLWQTIWGSDGTT